MNKLDPFDYHDKLHTFMKALEINNLDEFLNGAEIKDYESLGKEMIKRIKFLKNRVDELELGIDGLRKLLEY